MNKKDKQLEEKDKQISNLQKLIDQSQQLQAIAENKIKLLEQKETPPEPVNGSPSIESKKRLFSSIVWEIIMKIIKNRARCKNCGDIIESKLSK